jgi:Tfp pilus assembly protein PilP
LRPQFDGPGSFGELQDTVTLDCLSYVGSIQKDSHELVLIRDERGVVHRLRVGDYMGENTGVIARIDRDAIYIEQRISRNGEVETVTVRFPKGPVQKAPESK